ncbi:MAG: hypothetical protein CEN90_134 [Parcubacteria group bacterium Licking1014_17]|nr:MAG: hypothetical protein CEN90_134 [Parcubacteria group bacterium Licking1014_17]
MIGLVLLLIFVWAPWITKGYAESIVSERFSAKWQGVGDGCGFNCKGCGVKESHRTLFGITVKIEYACGMLPSDSPEYHRIDSVFVSFLGTVHGL